MKPIFFDFELPVLGRLEFPAYLTMVLAGFIVAILYARRQAVREGVSSTAIVDLGVLMLVCGILGARILAVLTDGHFLDFVHLCIDPGRVPAEDALVAHCTGDAQCGFDYLCNRETGVCYPPRDCLAALKFWQGGLTYYGGFLLAVPVGLAFARRRHLVPLQVADIGAPAVALGLVLGRFGCFFNGCCYGARTTSWLGVTLPGRFVAQHPTQLYESAAALLLFFILHFAIRPRKRGHGEVFGWWLVLYGVVRFMLELFRADPRGSLGPFSTSQLLSLPLVAAGAWLVARSQRSPDLPTRATREE